MKITKSLIEKMLRELEPTAQLSRIEEYGVAGARATTRTGGKVWVLAQCFGPRAIERAGAAALHVLRLEALCAGH